MHRNTVSSSSTKVRRTRRSRFERLEDRHLLSATPIEVLAAGKNGDEQMQLLIDGDVVQTWNSVGGDFDARQFESFTYTHPTAVSADQIRVRFSQGTGTRRDLRVDGLRVDDQFYEAESASTYSTGTWDNAAGDCVPRFAQSEVLHCQGGYFDFAQGDASIVEVLAIGVTASETVAIEVDGQQVATFENVGGSRFNRRFVNLRYAHTGPLSPDQVRVVLVDGTNNQFGNDRNAIIDAVILDGQRFEMESPDIFSVGSWSTDNACGPGFKQSETLHCSGGYFQLPSSAMGSVIDVHAAGATGRERMELLIDGESVRTWERVGGDYDARQFIDFRYRHSEFVTADRVQVAFTNDGAFANLGEDLNLRVDGVTIDGVKFESEAATTRSTGTWTSDVGCAPGFKQSELLHCNGALDFLARAANPGVIGIGSTQFVVGEAEGVARVNFLRTGGADGPATVDFTTVPGTATPGVDYTTTSGVVTFADGQTEAFITVPIANDSAAEGTETFNVAIDRVTGAIAGQPRTTTVSIFDDEQPSPGSGNGLQGDYYSGLNFGTLLLTRTDATVDFDWVNGAPAPGLPSNQFSVVWSGQVEPLYSEEYIFRTTTDDGVRLWVDGELLIDQWVDQSATRAHGKINLLAGRRYDVRMEYYENGGQASAVLEWRSDSQTQQTIPTSQLYSDPVTPIDGTFSGETLVSGLSRPTAIEFAPTGQMFIAQKDGIVRVFENGALVSGSFIDLRDEVNDIQDRGLLGLEVDPDFPAEPYIYLLYTYDPPETLTRTGLAGPDGAGNRVSRLIRVTADASNNFRTVVPGSEVILLGENSVWENISNPDQDGTNNVNLPESCDGVEDCVPVDSRSHSIGALAFGPDGSLFITNGDGTSFGRVDPRTVRVQDLDNLAGKVLRINPDTGRGVPDNPFYDSENPDGNRSKVYSYGLRNPFRMAIHPETGEPYVGDVGWNTWEEINTGRGANFGWPFYEGGDGENRPTGGYRNLPEADAFYANNNAVPPLYSRSHRDGGVAVVMGDFYTGSVYPAEFQNTLFYTDFGDPTIRAIELAPDGSVARQRVVTGPVGAVVEMTMGPDGLMYYVDLNGGVVGFFRFDASATAEATIAFSLVAGPETPLAMVAAAPPLIPSSSAAAVTLPPAPLASSDSEEEPVTGAFAPTPSPAATDQALLLLLDGQDDDPSEDEGFGGNPQLDEEELEGDADETGDFAAGLL
ncbi:MAG: PQQ-dependent sugar dehydrogenase [Planctomycetota bacterium]